MESTLFRKEVMEARKARALGNVVLVHPTSHYLLAFLGLGMLVLMVAFMVCGHFTRRVTVPGVLEPIEGVVKVYAGRIGQLRASDVRDGQFVHKGDILFHFTSEHVSENGQAVEVQTEATMKTRLATLKQELNSMAEIGQADVANAKESLSALRDSEATLKAQISAQVERVKAAEVLVGRYEELQRSGFMPDAQVQEKRNDLIDQQVKLQSMRKEFIGVTADIGRQSREVVSAPVRASVTQAQIERNIAGTEAELGMQQNSRDWSIVAPCDGYVSGVTVKAGQSVDGSVPVVTLIPASAVLQAILYAHSRDLGFVKPGQVVKIKLEAFPFQKFGLATGKIISVTDSPILATELSPSTRLLATGDKSEPLYAIKVALDKQTIDAYGQAQRLRAGMQLGADVELDKRLLYEWMLEPLLSVKGT